MESTVLVIATWAVLCLVLVAYVIYRILTDRPSGATRHPLYPLVSNPGDGMMPGKEPVLLAGYVSLVLALIGLLAVLYLDVVHRNSTVISSVSGGLWVLGLLLIAVGKRKQDRS
ncbi:hypothetical protein KEM63_11145 [Halopseudomonas nanhaiensis]|uniref:hypothetical protein n=1 Tax=Halopseudomonas nanhaiensis TaxID=2830842 RepID=UPI001CBD89C5|nr:hypothetical protein [Halopseudomonas nanhaiensis]UAW97373.1 hypothetical protein KEM63_11145 [Halopseudomonas nanhaiensis]